MRKKILISALLICGLSMSVFAVFGRRAPEPNPVKDFPVKQELEQRLQACVAYTLEPRRSRSETQLQKLFGMDREAREIARETEGCDPVEQAINILRKHGAALAKEKWIFRESGRPGLGVYRAVAKGDGATRPDIEFRIRMNAGGCRLLAVAELPAQEMK